MNEDDEFDIAQFDVPKDYFKYSKEQKQQLCNKIVDTLLTIFDRDLDPTINRITFLDEVLQKTLEENERYEMYEVCSVISDCLQQLKLD
ncbi:hypothetical protein UFOVP185_9 [uncultured Caudovirales phage]|uniref:Uncharacterized protein n=1 Tax=uncultured Caudovirales phage TaxID=2100421 RepID=A0A6J7WJQ6_9CAUD|nr:hypothetical protein UFOVP185_9 [uncultured Caudovirales phage]